MTKPIKAFFKWLFDLGIKLITKLLRSSAEAEGVPQYRLPTERDVTWELGYAVLKRVAKAGLDKMKDRTTTIIKSPFTRLLTLAKVINPKKDTPLAINI